MRPSTGPPTIPAAPIPAARSVARLRRHGPLHRGTAIDSSLARPGGALWQPEPGRECRNALRFAGHCDGQIVQVIDCSRHGPFGTIYAQLSFQGIEPLDLI